MAEITLESMTPTQKVAALLIALVASELFAPTLVPDLNN